MNDVNNHDLDEGFDGDDDVTIAASSDALALIRETAKNLRTDGDEAVNSADEVDEITGEVEAVVVAEVEAAEVEDGLADDPTLPAKAYLDGGAASLVDAAEVDDAEIADEVESEFADEPTMPASAYRDEIDAALAAKADEFVDELVEDPTVNPDAELLDDPTVNPDALEAELVDDATAARDTKAAVARVKANSQRSSASARAQVMSSSRSLIGSSAPPETSTSYWDPNDAAFNELGALDDHVSMGPRKRFPKWVLIAAFVAAAVVIALAVFVAVASAQGVS